MNVETALLGESRAARRRYVLLGLVPGLGVALAALVARYLLDLGDIEGFAASLLLLTTFLGATCLLTVLAGYRGAGLLVCVAIPSLLLVGFTLLELTTGGGGLHWKTWLAAPTVGVPGFVVGKGLRYVVSRSGYGSPSTA